MHTEPTRTHAHRPGRRGSTSLAAVALAAGTVLLAAPAAAQSSAEVLLTDANTFEPEQVTVEEGGTVDFRWEGGNTHNVAFDDETSETTSDAGVNFSRTFDAAGTFAFTCTIHPTTMSGTVTVEAAAADPAPQPDTDEADDDTDQVEDVPSDASSPPGSVPQPNQVDAGTAGDRAGLGPWTTLAVVLGMLGLAVPVALAAARRR